MIALKYIVDVKLGMLLLLLLLLLLIYYDGMLLTIGWVADHVWCDKDLHLHCIRARERHRRLNRYGLISNI